MSRLWNAIDEELEDTRERERNRRRDATRRRDRISNAVGDTVPSIKRDDVIDLIHAEAERAHRDD
jgi:hypothetical protein